VTDPVLPPAALALLRHALFLGPLAAAVILLRRRRAPREAVGALFAFLYGLSLVFLGHVVAIGLGAWSYGGEALKLLGFPADLWFGGALLWGPVVFLLFPRASPWAFVIPCTMLNGLALPLLPPFFEPGRLWFAASTLVFLTAHLPALFLARWTAEDVHLPRRAFLLALAYGPLAFLVMPSVIMHAMGGSWSVLPTRSPLILVPSALATLGAFVIGLSAVQVFALHGGGTPIPLDPTKRLVRTGLYAYVANPMQLSTALAWAALGAALGNLWVALAAAMAVCFVLGLVRWHHRQDLAVRFPEGWPAYRDHVPEWLPRWRPWMPAAAALRHDRDRPWQSALLLLLARLGARGLETEAAPGPLLYREPGEERAFTGLAAAAKALNHANFATALLGAALLLAVLPLATLLQRLRVVPTGWRRG